MHVTFGNWRGERNNIARGTTGKEKHPPLARRLKEGGIGEYLEKFESGYIKREGKLSLAKFLGVPVS